MRDARRRYGWSLFDVVEPAKNPPRFAHALLVWFDTRSVSSKRTNQPSDRLRLLRYVEQHLRHAAEEAHTAEFGEPWPSLTVANLHLLARISALNDRTEKPNDQNENVGCLDDPFRNRCYAGIGSAGRQAGDRKPLRFGVTVQPARGV